MVWVPATAETAGSAPSEIAVPGDAGSAPDASFDRQAGSRYPYKMYPYKTVATRHGDGHEVVFDAAGRVPVARSNSLYVFHNSGHDVGRLNIPGGVSDLAVQGDSEAAPNKAEDDPMCLGAGKTFPQPRANGADDAIRPHAIPA